MKMKELKELDVKALAEKLESEKAQLNQLKLNHSVAPLENPSQIKAARRSVGNKKFKKSKTGCCCQQQDG